MGDSGEGLIDAEARIQERIEELERERQRTQPKVAKDPEKERTLESLRLARLELQSQAALTTNERRRAQIADAVAEIDRRVSAVGA
jgi:ABC-type lipopolysaccharide export system ATPase subunit